jgi:hypothetical protein
MPLLVVAIVVQAVLLACCVMAYRLSTGEAVARAARLSRTRRAFPKQQNT